MDIREFSLELFSLENKTAIVTGGNTGLGRAFSLALAKAGANIFIPTVTDDGGDTSRLIESEGRRAELLKVDITEAGAPRWASGGTSLLESSGPREYFCAVGVDLAGIEKPRDVGVRSELVLQPKAALGRPGADA